MEILLSSIQYSSCANKRIHPDHVPWSGGIISFQRIKLKLKVSNFSIEKQIYRGLYITVNMAGKIVEILKRNIVTAFVIVALPLMIALCFLAYMIQKSPQNWGWGYVAILIALIVQYPYLKIADRYFFK